MNIRTIVTIIVIGVLLAAPAAIAGSLKRNLDMEKAFKEGRPPMDLRYYATGRANAPDAIIGIDPEWRQTARFWREIDPKTDDLNKLIRNLFSELDYEPRASDIVTKDGEVIGVYWSKVYWTSVTTGQGNEVSVIKPRQPRLR